MMIRSWTVFQFAVCALVLTASADAQTRPPVILVDGYRSNCGTADRTSTGSFGQLQQRLSVQGVEVQFFRPCSVLPAPAPIEKLGEALGQRIGSLGVAEVDLVMYSMGCVIGRSYLAGKQIDPGVFTPPSSPKVRKAVFIAGPHFGEEALKVPLDVQTQAMLAGSQFVWDLNTWNQGTDDLRQVDAIAVVGNYGGIDDGLEVLTSASIVPFGYPEERTRIVPLCHYAPLCSTGIASIDSDAHPTWRIIDSFLRGTEEWKTVGQTPSQDPTLSRTGGLLLALRNGSDGVLSTAQVSVAGLGVNKGTVAFFKHLVEVGDYTLQATGPVEIPSLRWRPIPGGFSVATMKPGPIIARAVPSAGLVGTLSLAPGSFISVYGTRLGTGLNVAPSLPLPTALGETTVTLNERPIGLHFVGENQINAVLPDDVSGLVKMMVRTSQGVHSINILIEDAVPAVFTLSQAGSGPAAARHALTGAILDEANPAGVGEYVSVYLTGLGATEPFGGLQAAKIKPEATVDGVAAKVDWAGRAPGYVGLDQVNIVIPAGIRTGMQVPLVIKSGKRLSNTTTLAVK